MSIRYVSDAYSMLIIQNLGLQGENFKKTKNTSGELQRETVLKMSKICKI